MDKLALIVVLSAPMDLEAKIRQLIKDETDSGLRLNLRQVADKTGVKYKRLWHFMSEKYPQKLSLLEAQAVFEALSGQPLLTEK